LADGGLAPEDWAKAWLANLLGTTLIAIFAFVGRYNYIRFRDTEGEFDDLKADLTNRQQKLDKLRSDFIGLKLHCDDLQARLPETALAVANKEMNADKFTEADQALTRWLENEGEFVSKLLLHRAKWADARAVGDLRAQGMVAAEPSIGSFRVSGLAK
jgi:hypothetical protein